jgi:tRNA dimethylallyltransferase
MKQSPYKHIVIIGPTASGKSDLAIDLAKKYDGEIISADSRQVYRGMDRGTGKVTRDPSASHPELVEGSPRSDWDSSTRRLAQNDTYTSEGIRHHLIDIASPRREYNISHFLRDAKKAIADIEKRGKLPIICGGTHFWVQALLTGEPLPPVKPNNNLRAQLEKKSTEELFRMLEEQNPERAKTIDAKNPYRLIRALEIIESLGKVPALGSHPELVEGSPKSDWDSSTRRLTQNDNSLIIAINPEKQVLRERIQTRLKKRFNAGMIEEVRQLSRDGISWKRLESFGLEYRYIALFLQGKMTETEMKEKLFFEIWHYAKRQLSFIRRMEKHGLAINWAHDTQHALQTIIEQSFRPEKITL